MAEAIGAVLALAIAVGVSPIPLIAIVAVLFSARSKVNSTVFLAVWFTGLVGVGTAAYLIAAALDIGGDDATVEQGVQWIRLVVGTLLILVAVRKWRKRPGSDAEPELPGWMSGLDRLSAMRTAVLAGGLSVNPKNLMLGGAAGVSLAEANPTTAVAVVALLSFALVGSALVATAVAYRMLGGDDAVRRLEVVRSWLARHNNAVLAVVFFVIGAVLVAQGAGLLSEDLAQGGYAASLGA